MRPSHCFLIPHLHSFSIAAVRSLTPSSLRCFFQFQSSMKTANSNQIPASEPSIPTTTTTTANNKLNKFHQLLRSESDSANGWDKCWDEGITPWDLGGPTPLLVHLHNLGSLPKGRVLIPGCGTGYDVVAIACAERHVVGIDISESAIKKADWVRPADQLYRVTDTHRKKELSSRLPNAKHFTFLKEDFFTWCPSGLFDLIFDYTFFCAIEPELRPLWARKINDLLKSDGELITLMFPIDDHEGGPPYRVSVTDYEEVLHGIGFKAIHIADNQLAVGGRMGREKMGRWKRCINQSML